MNERKKMPISTPVLLASVAGGLVLYLAPKDGRVTFSSPFRELFVVLMAVLVSVLLLAVSRRYDAVGVALVVMIAFVFVNYVSYAVGLYWQDKELGHPFTLNLDYYEAFCWGLIWFIPFLICITIRVFASGGWDTQTHHEEFSHFFKMAGRAFYVYYTIAFLACFVFFNPIDVGGIRTVHLIPFENFFGRFSGSTGSLSFFGNLLFFTPLGFFAAIRMKKPRWYKLLLVGVITGALVESVQFALNTGAVETNDAILNLIGVMLGFWLKFLLDKIRSFVTNGEETQIRYL